MLMERELGGASMQRYPNVPGAKSGSPETAFEAAARVKVAAGTIRERALRFVTSTGFDGATCDEVAQGLGLEVLHSSRARLSELVAMGLIVNSGRRRRGVSGRSQSVWVLIGYKPHCLRKPQLDFLGLLHAD